MLTSRFGKAVTYAVEVHHGQVRKGSGTPYVAHLLGAASFLLDQDGTTEDQAIAALLHDAIEDQPDRTSREEIARRFGEDVAQMVMDCTDAEVHPKPPWRHRKVAYLTHLESVAEASLQVSLADKLHNARAMLTDLQTVGPDLWSRFSAPPVAQRWYYTALADVFTRRLGSPLSHALAATVAELTAPLPADVPLSAGIDRPDWVSTDSVTGAAVDSGTAAETTGELVEVGADAWRSADDRWWVEAVDAGDPARPLTIFIRPVP